MIWDLQVVQNAAAKGLDHSSAERFAVAEQFLGTIQNIGSVRARVLWTADFSKILQSTS